MFYFKVFFLSFISLSCSRIYLGSYDQVIFDEINQPNILSDNIELWEDGLRTEGKRNQYEWWYMDAKLDDGSVIVAYFYKVHFIKDRYFIGFNYTSPEGKEFFKLKYFKKSEVQFESDSCYVTMGENSFSGNLNKYKIRIDPTDFDGFGFNLVLTSNSSPYRPQDGIIKAGESYFAWLAAVPSGKISGNIIIDNENKSISGSGYHDHNWGNIPLQRLFKSWTWFRGKAGPYTVIVAELNTVNNRGGFDIPILFVGKNENIIVDKFGNRELYTMKNSLIKNLYTKKNEPQFSNFLITSDNNISVAITGIDIIENINIFKRMKVPLPVRWAFSYSNIDPYYTRFSSNFTLKLNSGLEFEGKGIMEIMDLQ